MVSSKLILRLLAVMPMCVTAFMFSNESSTSSLLECI